MFNDIKKDRTEDIGGLIFKIDDRKEKNNDLYYLKERNLNEEQIRKMQGQEDDLRSLLYFIE